MRRSVLKVLERREMDGVRSHSKKRGNHEHGGEIDLDH